MAYKWYKRYNDDGGLDGLKDQPRSGRPPDVPKEVMIKIQKKNYSRKQRRMGFQTGNGSDIQKEGGVRYHEVHIYRLLLHKWGFKSKVLQKRFVNTASEKYKKKRFKKG